MNQANVLRFADEIVAHAYPYHINDVLVAPIVDPKEHTRPIYLPSGEWRDHWTGRIVQGPGVLQDYPAPLELLSIFHRFE